ncbi:hypothetical protein PAMP_020635 [Pampus punctatissimus]
MALIHTGLLILLCCSTYSYTFGSVAGYGPVVQDPELEWDKLETATGEEMPRALAPGAEFQESWVRSGSLKPEAKKVPEYRIVSSSVDQKLLFEPAKGFRPLPYSVKEMLLVTAPPKPPASGPVQQKVVEVLCYLDAISVSIRKFIFKSKDASSYLKLGTCPVTKTTADHYSFWYELTASCGFKKKSGIDDLVISIVLGCKPPGPIFRDITFEIPLQCKYPRFFHSYQVGFYPKLLGGTVFKSLLPQSSFILVSIDASGKEITGVKTYDLGQTMYFEAKQTNPSPPGNKRLYIHKCFMTASPDSSSKSQYVIIDKQGCMIDGKLNLQSKFIAGDKKSQKFSVSAFIFKDMASSSSKSWKFYMHCEVSLGSNTATEKLKACNYNPTTGKWKALYGASTVCTCCDSSCPATKAYKTTVCSPSWKVDLSKEDDAGVSPEDEIL